MPAERIKQASTNATLSSAIFAVAKLCIQQYTRLLQDPVLEQHEDEVPHNSWKESLDRLRVWYTDLGSYQSESSSLDYRLRNASHISHQLINLLHSYKRALDDLQAFVGQDTNEAITGTSDSDDDWTLEQGCSYFQDIYQSIENATDNLNKISSLIRSPAQYDWIISSKRGNITGIEQLDLNHVEDKFPLADPVIRKRLADAISRRRRELNYRQRIHVKLEEENEHVQDEQHVSATDIVSPVESSLTWKLGKDIDDIGSATDLDSDSDQPDQSSISTPLPSSKIGVSIPPPPLESENEQTFKCPFCFSIISVANRSVWAQHVLEDISPYVCIYRHCNPPKRLYASREDWWQHECQHLLKHQAETKPTYDCPLCQGKDIEKSLLSGHIGRHLEDLASHVLPRNHEGFTDDKAEFSQEFDYEEVEIAVAEPVDKLTHDSWSTFDFNSFPILKQEKDTIVLCAQQEAKLKPPSGEVGATKHKPITEKKNLVTEEVQLTKRKKALKVRKEWLFKGQLSKMDQFTRDRIFEALEKRESELVNELNKLSPGMRKTALSALSYKRIELTDKELTQLRRFLPARTVHDLRAMLKDGKLRSSKDGLNTVGPLGHKKSAQQGRTRWRTAMEEVQWEDASTDEDKNEDGL